MGYGPEQDRTPRDGSRGDVSQPLTYGPPLLLQDPNSSNSVEAPVFIEDLANGSYLDMAEIVQSTIDGLPEHFLKEYEQQYGEAKRRSWLRLLCGSLNKIQHGILPEREELMILDSPDEELRELGEELQNISETVTIDPEQYVRIQRLIVAPLGELAAMFPPHFAARSRIREWVMDMLEQVRPQRDNSPHP